MTFALRKPKTTVFTMFCAFGSKNHGIYISFCLGPSNRTGRWAEALVPPTPFIRGGLGKGEQNYYIDGWEISINSKRLPI